MTAATLTRAILALHFACSAAIAGNQSSASSAVNVFSSPQTYRQALIQEMSQPPRADLFRALNVYVFPTKFCPVGCAHCYFQSPRPDGRPGSNAFTDETVSKLTDLFSAAGVGKLVVTGGGDPLMNRTATLRLLRESKATQLVLHTSGFWGTTPEAAERILSDIFTAFEENKQASQCTLRLSVDEFHAAVPDHSLLNVIEAYLARTAEFSSRGFDLAIHTIEGDRRFRGFAADIAARHGGALRQTDSGAVESVELPNGVRIAVTNAPLMPANAMPDMRDSARVDASVQAFDRGRVPHPAIVTTSDGDKKAVLVVHEDGASEIWNSGPPDHLPNINTLSKEKFLEAFGELIYSASMARGALYIESLTEEADPHAVRRAKSIASATYFNKNLLAEAGTRLYVSIRIIQDRLASGELTWDGALNRLPPELQRAIRLPREDLVELLRQSERSIIDDYLEDPAMTVEKLAELESVLRLGHFSADVNALRRKVETASILSPAVKAAYLTNRAPVPDTERGPPQGFLFRALWSNDELRRQAIHFFSVGIMKGHASLVDRFVRRAGELARSEPPLSDEAAYAELRRHIARDQEEFARSFQADDDMRIRGRIGQIAAMVKSRPKAVLDIGAGDGRIAEGLQKLWRLPFGDVHALEVAQYSKTDAVHWVSYREDGSVPLPDSSVDVVTCLMALHHMERPETVLREARRVMKSDATLIIRETDAAQPDQALFSAVMDQMFYSVFSPHSDVPTPTQYRSAADWKVLFEREGFSVSVMPSGESKNPFRPVYFLLSKRPIHNSKPRMLPIIHYMLAPR